MTSEPKKSEHKTERDAIMEVLSIGKNLDKMGYAVPEIWGIIRMALERRIEVLDGVKGTNELPLGEPWVSIEEYKKRIAALEAEVSQLKKENVELKKNWDRPLCSPPIRRSHD